MSFTKVPCPTCGTQLTISKYLPVLWDTRVQDFMNANEFPEYVDPDADFHCPGCLEPVSRDAARDAVQPLQEAV